MSSLSSYENVVFPWEGSEVVQVLEEQEALVEATAKDASTQTPSEGKEVAEHGCRLFNKCSLSSKDCSTATRGIQLQDQVPEAPGRICFTKVEGRASEGEVGEEGRGQ